MTDDSQKALLELRDFSCYYQPSQYLVHGAQLKLNQGEIIGITGVSGEGKSTLLRCLADYHPLVAPSQEGIIDRKGLEAKDISLIFQHSEAHLNPIRTVGRQLRDLPVTFSETDWKKLLASYGLSPEEEFYNKYPFENSGGQNQRIGWMMSLAARPRLVLADEPVSNLDHRLKNLFAEKLLSYTSSTKAGAIVVSHDTAWLAQLSSKVYQLQKGQLSRCETGQPDKLRMKKQGVKKGLCLLQLNALNYRYPGNTQNTLKGLHLDLYEGQITGIYGPSGEGKSTLLKIINGDIAVSAGIQWLDKNQKAFLISQNPVEEFHPLHSIKKQLQDFALQCNTPEPLWLLWAKRFGIDPARLTEKPAALSGGQLQRCAIIKALISRPTVLLLDEVFSGLDDDNFYTIIKVLEDICQEEKMAIVMVMHRQDLLGYAADQLFELKEGRIESAH